MDEMVDVEYGSQDFYGLIDDIRIWRRVRSEAEIKEVHTHVTPA